MITSAPPELPGSTDSTTLHPATVLQPTVVRISNTVGRAFVALLFILAGVAKIIGPAPFTAHMSRFGVPAIVFPAVVALELGAGFALLIGWRVRYAAWALAVFCLMTAGIFHHELGISAERTSFFKDLAIAGGLLAIAAAAGRDPVAAVKTRSESRG